MAGYGVEKVDFVRPRARNEATEVPDRNYPLVRKKLQTERARYSLKMPLSEAGKDDFLLLDRFHMFRLSLPSDVAESGSVLTVSFVTCNGKAFSEEITVE